MDAESLTGAVAGCHSERRARSRCLLLQSLGRVFRDFACIVIIATAQAVSPSDTIGYIGSLTASFLDWSLAPKIQLGLRAATITSFDI
jgi:hypothetical protein